MKDKHIGRKYKALFSSSMGPPNIIVLITGKNDTFYEGIDINTNVRSNKIHVLDNPEYWELVEECLPNHITKSKPRLALLND